MTLALVAPFYLTLQHIATTFICRKLPKKWQRMFYWICQASFDATVTLDPLSDLSFWQELVDMPLKHHICLADCLSGRCWKYTSSWPLTYYIWKNILVNVNMFWVSFSTKSLFGAAKIALRQIASFNVQRPQLWFSMALFRDGVVCLFDVSRCCWGKTERQ